MTTDIKDGNDAQRAGVNLQDLLDAAETSAPVVGTDAARAAQEGIRVLNELSVEVRRAQDGATACEHIRLFMADEPRLWAGANAWAERELEVRPLLLALEGQRECKRYVSELRTSLRKLAKEAKSQRDARKRQRDEAPTPLTLRMVTEDLGIEGLKMPPGWTLSEDGLHNTDELVSKWPILISGVLRDVDTGAYKLRVSWRRGDAWEDTVVERDVVMVSRKMEALINAGAPVNSNSASALVGYFSSFEVENLERLPESKSCTHMGWVSDRAFLYSRDSVGKVPIVLAESPTERGLIDSLACRGTWAGWLATAWSKYILPRPMVQAGVYTAMASLLLEPLDLQGFVLDYSGLTSVGKTTTLRAIASAYGVPDEDGQGLVHSWASAKHSTFGHMRKAYLYQSFPLILDETKRQRETPENVASMLYDHPSGQQRAQGQANSTLRTRLTWRSVLISTGEAPITSFTNDGGAQARALTLRGSPWGEKTKENAESASEAKRDFLDHYGHLGRRFVGWLLENRQKWPELRERYATYRAQLVRTNGGPEARLYEYVAVIKLAAMLCHEKLDLPGEWGPAIKALDKAVKEASKGIDMPRKALDSLATWAFANQAKFYGRDPDVRLEPVGGWAGSWDNGDFWVEISIDPNLCERLLEGWKHDSKSVLSAWRERGWVRLDGVRNPKISRFHGRRLVTILRKFIDDTSIEGDEP